MGPPIESGPRPAPAAGPRVPGLTAFDLDHPRHVLAREAGPRRARGREPITLDELAG